MKFTLILTLFQYVNNYTCIYHSKRSDFSRCVI